MEQPRPPKTRHTRSVVMPRIFTELVEQEDALSLGQSGPEKISSNGPEFQQNARLPVEHNAHVALSDRQALGADRQALGPDIQARIASQDSFLLPADQTKIKGFVDQVIAKAAVLSEQKEERLRRSLLDVPREPFVYGGDPWSDVQTDTHFGTLSFRPSLVVRMLSLLPLNPGDRVLDVSSGVGYTLALLESMGLCAFGVEKIPSQAQYSRKLLDKLNLCGAVIRAGEPYRGWAEAAPFDGIIISGPLIKVPRSLFLQLNPDQGFLVCIIVTKKALRLCLYRRLKGKLSCIRLESL